MRPFALILLACLSGPALAGDEPLAGVPSGQRIWWQDAATTVFGGRGTVLRYRFVAPGLAHLVPMAPPEPMESVTEEDMAALEDIAAAEEQGIDPDADADQGPVISILEPGSDVPAVPPATGHGEGPVLPPAPESLLRDPMHEDIVWLCENFVLPRIAGMDPRPAEIVISLSDRAQDGATPTPGSVQLIETFRLPPDRDQCVWKPF